MASSGYTRVLVHLRRAAQRASYTRAPFNECIMDSLGLSDEGLVECSLQDNKLLLQSPAEGSVSTSAGDNKPSLYKIMHSPFCPIHHLDKEGKDSLPPEIVKRGVDVGVAVLLESSDQKLLFTRRAEHMKIYPSIWVNPGGHVEDGESLEDAALRELEEETGLVVSEEERKSSRIVGLWESVYPPMLSMGEPKRHHVVVFLHTIHSKTSEQLNKEFKLCPEEIDAAAWLPANLIRAAAVGGEDQPDSNEVIPVTLVNKDGEHLEGSVESSILTGKQESHAADFDRVSIGNRHALSYWLSQRPQEVDDTETSQHHLCGQFMRTRATNPHQKSKL